MSLHAPYSPCSTRPAFLVAIYGFFSDGNQSFRKGSRHGSGKTDRARFFRRQDRYDATGFARSITGLRSITQSSDFEYRPPCSALQPDSDGDENRAWAKEIQAERFRQSNPAQKLRRPRILFHWRIV